MVASLLALPSVAHASHEFSDVPDGNPYHGDISWMAADGITNGFPDGTYRPASSVTRQSMAAFLHRLWGALGQSDPVLPDPGFSDVPGDHPFHDDIAWMVTLGITTGYPDGTYRPAALVTRQSMAAFLHRLWTGLGEDDVDPLPDPGFTDVADGHPFHDDIAWMAALEITTGFPDGTYRPAAAVSRQSMAAFLHRMWGQIGFVVDNGSDLHDAAIGDGRCDIDTASGDVGDCTLRAAIDEANAWPNLPNQTVALSVDPVLTLEGLDEDDNLQGDLDVHSDVTLQGGGHTVSGGGVGRVFQFEDADVVITALAITGGHTETGVGAGIYQIRGSLTIRDSSLHDNVAEPPLGAGGGLASASASVLIEDTQITDNRAAMGGGIVQGGGTLELRSSAVERNSTSVVGDIAQAYGGGGVYAYGGAELLVTDSTLADNTAAVGQNGFSGGGALHVDASTAVVTDTEIRDNHSEGGLQYAGGGAVLVDRGSLQVVGSVIADNSATNTAGEVQGGGIAAYGASSSVEVVGSTVSGNTATATGAVHGGGLYGIWATLTIEHSTISDNVTDSASSASSGGGLASWGPLDLLQSTVSRNRATAQALSAAGGGLYLAGAATVDRSAVVDNHALAPTGFASGGGISSGSGELDLVASTVSGNEADGVGDSPGGGVSARGATITSTTISDNSADVGIGIAYINLPGNWPPVTITASIIDAAGAACSGPVTSAGYNISSDTSCGFTAIGDAQGVAALLGPLADNGGPTLTHLPSIGSPARDAIPTGTAGLCDTSAPPDQRGVTRPQGIACDIGSVEE